MINLIEVIYSINTAGMFLGFATIHYRFANFYKNNQNYEKSAEYFEKAIKIINENAERYDEGTYNLAKEVLNEFFENIKLITMMESSAYQQS